MDIEANRGLVHVSLILFQYVITGTLHGQISGTLLVSLVGAKCLSCPLTAQETAEVHPLPMSRLFIEKLVLFIFHPFVTLRVP